MTIETVNWVNDLNSTYPASSDIASQGDDHIRNIKSGLKATFPNASKAFYFPTSISKAFADSPYTLSTPNGVLLVNATSGAVTVNIAAAATMGDGARVTVKKTDSSANAVTIDPNGAETIDGASTFVLSFQYQEVTIVSDGSNWHIESNFTTYSTAVKSVLDDASTAAMIATLGTFAKMKITVFDSSGTYTPSTGLICGIAKGVGGGGGGGGAPGPGASEYSGGGGGGAGEYAEKYFTAADIGASKTVIIGAAGAAGTAGPNAGGDGGQTSLGTLLIAKGGKGGTAGGTSRPDFNLGGLGGTGGTGDILGPGQPGGGWQINDMGAGYLGGGPQISNFGGSGPYGAGGRARTTNSGSASKQDGEAAVGAGAGGAGGVVYNSGSLTAAGGAGTKGKLIIYEYLSQ